MLLLLASSSPDEVTLRTSGHGPSVQNARERAGPPKAPLFLPCLIPAIAWALTFALAWTRWSRVAVAFAVVAQIAAAVAMTARMDDLRVTLAAFMPLCLPVLPLLILIPERPQLTVALALVGRWRDAARTLAGWRWPLVDVGVLLFGDVAGVFARSFYGMSVDSAPAWTKKLWVHDLRTNAHFTLKTNPLKRTDLDDFVACYRPENRHQRRATWSDKKPEGQWRSYDYKEIVARDKCSLDMFWLKDESLEATQNLPPPADIAREIVEDLRAALEQFESVAANPGE